MYQSNAIRDGLVDVHCDAPAMPITVSTDEEETWDEDLIIRDGVVEPCFAQTYGEWIRCCSSKTQVVQFGGNRSAVCVKYRDLVRELSGLKIWLLVNR